MPATKTLFFGSIAIVALTAGIAHAGIMSAEQAKKNEAVVRNAGLDPKMCYYNDNFRELRCKNFMGRGGSLAGVDANNYAVVETIDEEEEYRLANSVQKRSNGAAPKEQCGVQTAEMPAHERQGSRFIDICRALTSDGLISARIEAALSAVVTKDWFPGEAGRLITKISVSCPTSKEDAKNFGLIVPKESELTAESGFELRLPCAAGQDARRTEKDLETVNRFLQTHYEEASVRLAKGWGDGGMRQMALIQSIVSVLPSVGTIDFSCLLNGK